VISPTVDSVKEIRLPPTPLAPGRARRAVRETLAGVAEPTLEAATLLVSELVTNSVRHAGMRSDGSVQVVIRRDRAAVRIEVADWGPGFRFQPRSTPLDQAGGWGLPLVEKLSQRWGIREGPPTTVWFELE